MKAAITDRILNHRNEVKTYSSSNVRLKDSDILSP